LSIFTGALIKYRSKTRHPFKFGVSWLGFSPTFANARGVLMTRTLILAIGGLAMWPAIAPAQAAMSGPKLDSPGEIAVWSTMLTPKQDYCRRQARARKLTYMKRRSFVRACVKREMGGR
jgi:hypothetical protein